MWILPKSVKGYKITQQAASNPLSVLMPPSLQGSSYFFLHLPSSYLTCFLLFLMFVGLFYVYGNFCS